ncbi:MAG: hypothetical protein KR126chlam1_00510 [Chlamydiae bacterium]|nr:hypothetical protein [Chlamydiota bacterium]
MLSALRAYFSFPNLKGRAFHKSFCELLCLNALLLCGLSESLGASCETCSCYYCLGPCCVNPSVGPNGCSGDFATTVSGLYWTTHQDGMEFAIENHVAVRIINPSSDEIEKLNQLVAADYVTPSPKWNYGFKVGASYRGCHDGWDIGAIWTHYTNTLSTHKNTSDDVAKVLLPLWSAFAPAQGEILFARDIDAKWKLGLDLIDIPLGRAFWLSHCLSLRPHIGLRLAQIDQEYDLKHKGGSWSPRLNPTQDPLSNEVELENRFKGIGLRAGLDSVWHLGCGFALCSDLAASIVYGRFRVHHNEKNTLAMEPHSETKFLETRESFRASRAMLDLVLGIQWATTFCDCCYRLAACLAWEEHYFFHQNQMWRVNRIGDTPIINGPSENLSGENVFFQRRGSLDTQGVTLTVSFEF